MFLLCLVLLQRHWTRVTQLIWMPSWLTCAALSRSSTPFPNQILLLAATAKDNSEPLGATVPVPSTQAPVEGGAVEVQNNTYCIYSLLSQLCAKASLLKERKNCQGRFSTYISGNSTKIHSLWLKKISYLLWLSLFENILPYFWSLLFPGSSLWDPIRFGHVVQHKEWKD